MDSLIALVMLPSAARFLSPLIVVLLGTRASVVVVGGSSTPHQLGVLGPAAAAAAAAAAMAAGSTCPRVCFCNSPSRIVYCSRRGLMSIPEGIADDSLQLNLNGNSFQSTTVVRANLSRYTSLEHLYLSECQLEHIEVGAFADLGALRWLDLSNNRLRSIRPDTFSGLRLQHLFLNGNRNIQVTIRAARVVCMRLAASDVRQEQGTDGCQRVDVLPHHFRTHL